MKSLKLGNWKFALFALGACVVATPVILSSCSSAAETASGHFVAFTNAEDYDQGKCSDEKFTIDGSNVTATAAGYGNLVFKLDNELKSFTKIDGKDVPIITTPEEQNEWMDSLPDSFTFDAVVYMRAYVSDNYLSNEQVKDVLTPPTSPTPPEITSPEDYVNWTSSEDYVNWQEDLANWQANQPKVLASCNLVNSDSDNFLSPISHLSLNNFVGVDGNPVPPSQSVDMYITLFKMSTSGKITKDHLLEQLIGAKIYIEPTYSAVKVSKFTFAYAPVA